MKKKILVRVDGSKEIGLGHVFNMITILAYFKNSEILILMDKILKQICFYYMMIKFL